MHNPKLSFGALGFLFAALASASPMTYDVAVNTSSIQGTVGSIDFNFNPGPLVTQAASLQILSFTSDGALAGSPVLTGDAAGALPGTLTLDNATAFNDYFEGFTFGSKLLFDVSVSGPALASPDGVSTSGSTFAFSMFSDAAGTKPVLTSDTTNGFALTADVNLDGSTTFTPFFPPTSVTSGASAAPEPASAALFGTVLACATVWGLRRRHRMNAPVRS